MPSSVDLGLREQLPCLVHLRANQVMRVGAIWALGAGAPAVCQDCISSIPHTSILPPCAGECQDRDQIFRHLDSGIISHHVLVILLYTGGNWGSWERSNMKPVSNCTRIASSLSESKVYILSCHPLGLSPEVVWEKLVESCRYNPRTWTESLCSGLTLQFALQDTKLSIAAALYKLLI